MKTPESVPVEEARRKFADILDGTQHHAQHWQITRRGKPAGYVVPPEWWTRAIEALEATPAAPAEEEH
jgi:prevent-host-death family protein